MEKLLTYENLCAIMVSTNTKGEGKMAKNNSNFKPYGIFDKRTNERVAVIYATKRVDDFDNKICTFYFAHIVIGKVDTHKHYVYELIR